MLTLIIAPNGEPRIRQRYSAPAVYLDHWAIRRLSDEQADLGERFIRALQLRNGTLLLWALNLTEFRDCHIETARRAEDFLERALRSAYFTSMDLEQLIAQEPVPRPAANTVAPPPDLEMLQIIGSRSSSLGQPYTVQGYLQAIVGSNRLTYGDMLETMVERWREMSQQSEFAAKARDYLAPATVPRTQAVLAELMRPGVVDSKRTFDLHDAVDVMHAVVPTSLCDYVLLDGDWEQRVSQLRDRGASFDPPLIPARCYSERHDGLRRFVTDLEASPMEWPQLFPP